MKTTVNFSNFVDAFRHHDRYDQFGYDALRIIFNYLEEYEESTGEEIELDVIAICCEYRVAASATIVQDYLIDVEGLEVDEIDDAVEEYLSDNTVLLGKCKDGFVYAQF